MKLFILGTEGLAATLRPSGDFVSAPNPSDDIDFVVRAVTRDRAYHHPKAIIEGIVSPLDFAKLYRPGDKVYIGDYARVIESCISYLFRWMIPSGVMSESDFLSSEQLNDFAEPA